MRYAIKDTPQDFQVYEDLGFLLTGSGEHLWLLVRKENLTTDLTKTILARAFNVSPQQVGYAGKKDRHAITDQWFSLTMPGVAHQVESQAETRLQQALVARPLHSGERLQILEAKVHQKKCHVGCHQGNRFVINVTTTEPLHAEVLRRAIAQLEIRGFANYFGEQRFGDGDDLEMLSARLMSIKPKRGRLKPKDAWTCSCLRASLFNRVLKARERHELWQKPVVGDLMMLRGSQSLFLVSEQDDFDRLQRRIVEGDIASTGPLFGTPGKQQTQGQVQAIESEILHQIGQDTAIRLSQLQQADRRRLWVMPGDIHARIIDSTTLGLEFWLPKGAYATVLIRCLFDYIQQSSLTFTDETDHEY